ncbi:hypothetical protein ACLOJK_005164 [Asimina triloba]
MKAIYKRSTVPVFKAHGMSQARISDCVNETFSAIRTVRSFGGEKRQMSMFGKLVLAYQNSGIKLGTLKSANETLTRAMVYVSLLALYSLGGSKVKAVQGVVNTLGDLRTTLAAVERINDVLSGMEIDESLAHGLEREIDKEEMDDESLKLFYNNASININQPTRSVPGLKSAINGCSIAWSGDICLEDVHFSYPLRPDVEVLSGLNLTLKCGTVTALVGPSGAGKSTVVQLLARFYEPTRGHISVAGEDIRTFDKSEWAQVVSIVNQEPVLFSVSVGENIAYGLPDEKVSKDDVIKAAKAANAHEFIISLPQGYDTPVGERGSLLSGGQRQRIAIARAILKNAPILILDEATSALDAVSERLVQDALNHLMKGRTTLVIAHRLSTVQNAHQISVCSDGVIAELGTHFELVSYRQLMSDLVECLTGKKREPCKNEISAWLQLVDPDRKHHAVSRKVHDSDAMPCTHVSMTLSQIPHTAREVRMQSKYAKAAVRAGMFTSAECVLFFAFDGAPHFIASNKNRAVRILFDSTPEMRINAQKDIISSTKGANASGPPMTKEYSTFPFRSLKPMCVYFEMGGKLAGASNNSGKPTAIMKKGTKRLAPSSDSILDSTDSDFWSKRVMAASHFNVHRAESSQQNPMASPTLDVQRAESSRQHVRALNTQFASWVQSQLQNHPDELWEDGVQDYLSHASHIMEKFSDVVEWLKANAATADVGSNVGHVNDKSLLTGAQNNEIKPQLDDESGMTHKFPTVSFANSWGSGLLPSGQPSIFSDNEPEQPSSPSLKKTEETGILVVHEVKCKVYVKPDNPADKAWKDMGIGQLSIKCIEGASKATKESKPTIIVRNDVGKVLLNALLYSGIKMNIQKNSITTIFHTLAGGNEAGKDTTAMARTYLLRLKTEEETNKLAAAIKEYAPAA